MYNIKKLFLFGSLIMIINTNTSLYCQTSESTQIDIIFDASGSMWGQINGKNKITIAREVMNDLLSDLKGQKEIQLSLRVYGHLNKKCDNSVLEVPMGFENHTDIENKIQKINPLGKTPIAYSLQESVNDFSQDSMGDKIIILVTDGIESCDGDICEAANTIKKSGIVTNIHIVGFGMKEEEIESLKCIAEPFNGKVLGASDAKELKDAFNKISEEVSIDKNVEIVGVDINNDRVYMDVDIYKNGDKVQTSDGTITKFSLTVGTYDIIAKSRDTDIVVSKKDLKIVEGEKIRVRLVFAEAKMRIKSIDSEGNSIYTFYTLYDKEGQEVLSKQGSGYLDIIVVPGKYDIKAYEQDTYSTLWQKEVEVKAGDVVEKVFSFAMGKLNIIPLTNNGEISSEYWWYEFYKSDTNEKIRTSAEGVGEKELELLPGNYSIKVLDGYNNIVNIIDNVEIQAGKNNTIEINL